MMSGRLSCSSLSSELSSLSEDLFTCTICFNPFDDGACKPKLLPCHHTFCSRCLLLLTTAKDQLCCPLCSNMCRMKPSGVESLPTNHYLITFLDALQSLRGQNPTSLPDSSLTADDVCKKHGNAPRFFWCDACRQAICTHCTAVDHSRSSGHSVRNLEDARRDLRDKVLSMLKEVKVKFTVIRVMRDQIREMRSPAAEKAVRVLRNAVKSPADNMAHVVSDEVLNPDDAIGKVSELVNSETSSDARTLQKNLDRIQGLLTTLNSVEQFVHQKRQEINILMRSKVLVTLIRPEVRFDYDRLFCPRCGNMCNIPDRISSGKQPYREQTIEHTCSRCGITVLEFSE